MLHIFTQKNTKGQGLLEAVIAITIIAVGVSGVISLSNTNLVATDISSREVIAANLAREGIEVIQNIRDSNYLDSTENWYAGLRSGTNNDDGILEYNETTHVWTVNFLSSGTDFDVGATQLYWDTGLGMYRQAAAVTDSDWEVVPYKRKVELNQICLGDETDYQEGVACSGTLIGFRVVSEVQWTERDRTRSVQLEKRLYNWR